MVVETVTINDVVVLRTGRGFQGTGCPEAGCAFEVADLDQLVAGYEATKDDLFLPLKLGHDPPPGAPAMGWVANLRRVGDRLLADFKDVPNKIAEAIKSRAYRTRSLELARGLTIRGRRYGWLVTGLALLGSDLPAVDGLGDINLSHRHACGDCDSLTPAEAAVAVALGLSPEAMAKQKIKDANMNEQGRQDGEQALRRLT